MNKTKKSTRWEMRASRIDKVRIAKLARCWNVRESEAVRRAVVKALAEKSKTARTKTKR